MVRFLHIRLAALFVRFAVADFFAFELLLVDIDAVLQTAQLLRERVGQVDLVEVVGRDALAVNLDDARLDADNGGVRRHFLQNDSICADAAVVATFAPVEISTLLPIVGWRLPVSWPVPPRVTPW